MVRLERLDVMASMWVPDRAERTRIGRLVEAAKDRGDDAAVALLASEVAEWAGGLSIDADAVVVPVPPSPDRPNRLVPAIAAALGARWGLPVRAAIERYAITPRLRDLEPAERRDAAIAGDYRLVGRLDASSVVLVDDVVLTGTTLEHVAGVLCDGGASRVVAVAVARSRRA